MVFLILSSDISKKGISIPSCFTFFEINKINRILKVGYGKDRIAKELKIGDFQCLCIYEETIAKATHCCIKLVGKDNIKINIKNKYMKTDLKNEISVTIVQIPSLKLIFIFIIYSK